MKAKYKKKGGDCMFRIRRDAIRKQKKLDHQQSRMEHGKHIPLKIPEGYIFTYKADIGLSEVDSAMLRKYKLVPYLNVYSKTNNPFEVARILYNIKKSPPKEELRGLHYKLTGVTKLDNKRFIEIRQKSYWVIEKRDIPDTIKVQSVGNGTSEQTVETYVLFTTVSYLRHLKDKRIITKPVTYNKDKRKPYIRPTHRNNDKLKLVCITDGTTVFRVKKYEAEKRIVEHPTIKYCSKLEYEKQLFELKKLPRISNQGQTIDKGGDIGKQITDPRTRRERRFVKQKQKRFSRYYQSQFVTGHWVTDPKDPKFEIFEETGEHKRIRHRIRPEKFTRPFYNPAKRKKAIEYTKVEKPYTGITISKFPYNKPITVSYKTRDLDGIETGIAIEQDVKMLNKNIIKEQPTKRKTKDGTLVDDIEQVVICSIKDVDKWCYQNEFKGDDSKETPWIPYVKTETKVRTTYKRPEFHLTPRKKKTSTWRHPISQNRSESKHLVMI